MNTVRAERVSRGWQWTTAVVGSLAILAAMAPATREANTTILHSTGELERVIVRAVPGQVGDAEQLVRDAGGSVGP